VREEQAAIEARLAAAKAAQSLVARRRAGKRAQQGDTVFADGGDGDPR